MAVQESMAMCKMNEFQEGTFTCPSGNSFICTCNTVHLHMQYCSFAHAILFICKQYFKMCGISIPYICQETNGKFLFR